MQIYRLCDDLSGPILMAMLVFSPWAFGTTEHWSIWCMNVAGYVLGALLLVKLFIRGLKQYPAPRWDHLSTHSGRLSRRRHRWTTVLNRVLAGLTLAVLAYILISAVNGRASYDAQTGTFQYRHFLSWLPHSFDVDRTWFYFWMYLGLAASFWALVDWLPGMTATEERLVHTDEHGWDKAVPMFPARLRTLLWVLCLNGALLGMESIIQRASGSNKLLFLVVPHVHKEGETQFGPYAYRSNAAQYFDLLWPLCLGFWWTLQRVSRGKAHHWLLLCAAVMAACPIISASRGGALVSGGILVLAMVYVAFTGLTSFAGGRHGGASGHTAGLLVLFAAATIFLGWYFGWDTLAPRMEQIGEGYEFREAMYAAAGPMAADYPWFGVGPGTFATVFQLYRYSTEVYWPEQLHNDWLETRITFGWVGLSLLLAALGCVALRWFLPGGLRGSRRFAVLSWFGLGGCLIFGLFDFPFQIHSTLFLFLVICAVLFGLSGNPHPSRK